MLHPAIGPNRYCGPGALAILTGLDTGDTARVLREVTGKRAICGVWWPAMLAASARLGLRLTPRFVAGDRRPQTLEQFAAGCTRGAVYLVLVTGHYTVLADGEACDNCTIYPTALARYRKRRARVRRAWEVSWDARS